MGERRLVAGVVAEGAGRRRSLLRRAAFGLMRARVVDAPV